MGLENSPSSCSRIANKFHNEGTYPSRSAQKLLENREHLLSCKTRWQWYKILIIILIIIIQGPHVPAEASVYLSIQNLSTFVEASVSEPRVVKRGISAAEKR